MTLSQKPSHKHKMPSLIIKKHLISTTWELMISPNNSSRCLTRFNRQTKIKLSSLSKNWIGCQAWWTSSVKASTFKQRIFLSHWNKWMLPLTYKFSLNLTNHWTTSCKRRHYWCTTKLSTWRPDITLKLALPVTLTLTMDQRLMRKWHLNKHSRLNTR